LLASYEINEKAQTPETDKQDFFPKSEYGPCSMTHTFINRIATAVPNYEVHTAFIGYAERMLQDPKMRKVFLRVAGLAGISNRFSGLQMGDAIEQDAVCANDFYQLGRFPATGRRMELYERFAPRLMRATTDKLLLTAVERARIKHVIVTSCTGFYAPGLDFDIIDHLGLSTTVERTMVGFMGCYAAFNALKLARHIVRSQPDDSVLIVNLELCTLHLQETQNLAEVLSFLIFGDGCAASLISADEAGLAMDEFASIQIANTRDLITWNVRDLGFDMHLSGRVPAEIGKTLRDMRELFLADGPVELWAVHPGGRSVLDSVEQSLCLRPDQLKASRSVLDHYGNMSSATVMFVLEELMRSAHAGEKGYAMSFGPGLTAETMRFHAI
jgi:alpha-pyrone synthase